MRLAKRHPRRWTPRELAILNNEIGTKTDEELGRKLGGRSKNAMKIAAYRKLGVNKLSNIYSARAVAVDLGVK